MRVIFRFVFLLIFLAIGLNSFAQGSNDFVKNFDAEAIDGKLYITWTTRAGFTCQDIHVEVSNDSTDGFERRGTYFGICGDASEKDYSYVLNDPIRNSINFLKLELGNYGYSNVISIQVVSAINEVLIIPNPVTSTSKIHFENRSNEQVQIEFYTTNGVLIHTMNTMDNSISLQNVPLPKGLIYYYLKGDDIITFRGKFIVASQL
ncbi:MAG: hypothetical protein COA58_02160 [Bacteroidetes bacterium]|nr:MAG: hypothetical protein COA58_02160 [Bacteroidota bacterium]